MRLTITGRPSWRRAILAWVRRPWRKPTRTVVLTSEDAYRYPIGGVYDGVSWEGIELHD